MLHEQAERTPPGQWVRVVGGWSEFQFAERRMATLDELNRAAPDTPVFVLRPDDRALLNRAALRAVGYTKDSPNPPSGEIQHDRHNPFVSLYWLVTDKTVGGLAMYPDRQPPGPDGSLKAVDSRQQLVFRRRQQKRRHCFGPMADFAVLSADYFSVPEEELKHLESVLTVVGGRPVYAAEEFRKLAPPLAPVLPEWSPVAIYGGYAKRSPGRRARWCSIRPSPTTLTLRYDFGGWLCWAFQSIRVVRSENSYAYRQMPCHG